MTPKEKAANTVDKIIDAVCTPGLADTWAILGEWMWDIEERLAKLEGRVSVPLFSNPCTNAPAGSYTHTYVWNATCTTKEPPPGTPCMWCGQPLNPGEQSESYPA